MKKAKDYFLVCFILLCSILVFVFREEVSKIGEFGYLGIFILCFLANLTVFLPAPSIMVVVSYSQVLSPVLVAIVGALGTTFGEMSGYMLGNAMDNISTKWKNLIDKISNKIKNAYLIVFIFALLPLPLFDLVGVYAGSKKARVPLFFISCYSGKLIKMLFYAVFIGNILSKLMLK